MRAIIKQKKIPILRVAVEEEKVLLVAAESATLGAGATICSG